MKMTDIELENAISTHLLYNLQGEDAKQIGRRYYFDWLAVEVILWERAHGKSFEKIARFLDWRGFPAPHGGRWNRVTVATMYRRFSPWDTPPNCNRLQKPKAKNAETHANFAQPADPKCEQNKQKTQLHAKI